MRVRTKEEVRVTELSSKLRKQGISEKNRDWAKLKGLEHLGYATKKKVFCLDCGESFAKDLVNRKRATCPHCQSKLKIEETKCITHKQVVYFAKTEIFEQYQVVRNYELKSNHKKGRKTDYTLKEILQYWINPKGKVTTIGLKHTYNWHVDSWNGDWSIRKDSKTYGYSNSKYDVYPYLYTPDSKFKNEYLKYGINKQLPYLNVPEAIHMIPNKPKLETLMKAKQYGLFARACRYYDTAEKYWASIKICLRNNYKPKDGSMYFDYLNLLEYFNKDLRNAKFVCPGNLKAEHDKLLKKRKTIEDALYEVRNAERAQRLAEEREAKKQALIAKMAESEIIYQKQKSAFIGLFFERNDLSISVLKNVEEFKIEAEQLNHCVFQNEYYLEENSLILSVKKKDIRLATVEVNLLDFSIEQVRGKHNHPIKEDEEIRKLVSMNMDRIAERQLPQLQSA